jgi:hypothetical protein
MELRPEQIVDLIRWLDAEVDNGGFHQFFNNSAGDKTADTIAALEEIGAINAAGIVRRAAAMFPGGMPPGNRDERMKILWREFPDPKIFDPLNEEFYAYPDGPLETLLANFAAKSGFPLDPYWTV